MATQAEGTHTSVTEFVDSKVVTIPITDGIIEKIMPFFPKTAKVISGYLSEEQLYWKVNYHWEVLLEAAEHCSGLSIDAKHKDILAKIKKSLESNLPDPKSGYRKSTTPGVPKDKSPHETILERHGIVAQCKRDFKAVVEAADVFKKSKRDPKALMLAYAPVAKPAQGKHATGYALDIKGSNPEIKRIAKSLGAKTTFDEGSHVHCEWPNGVDLSKQSGMDSAAASARAVNLGIDSRITNVRHCLLWME